jgi:hypothetical protein
MDAPVVIAVIWEQSEASVIKSLLESYSIPCHYVSQLPHRIYPVSASGLAEFRVYVPALLADAARRVLEEHRRKNGSLRLVEDDEEEPGKA